MTVQNMPKIELHLHLEGGAPPEFIRTLAAEKERDLGAIFDANGSYQYTDFVDFLRVYEAATSVLETPDDFNRLVKAVLEKSASHGVVYTEIFTASAFCGGADLGAWRDYFAAMVAAAEWAEETHSITARFINTAVRHFGPEEAILAAKASVDQAGDMLVGFGMGGDENYGVPADFKRAYDIARNAGLGLTVHAGEFGGPDSVRGALDALNVKRLGHGVRSIEDADLVKRLADEGVVLEVNPGSNIALGLYPDHASHPIHDLADAGVGVTISTDDPPYFHTDMTVEYQALLDAGWSTENLTETHRTALHAAFCTVETKERIAAKCDITL